MSPIIKLLVCLMFITQQGFTYYNERKYEGIPDYQVGNYSIQKRLEIIDYYLPSFPVVFEAGAYDGSRFCQNGENVA